MKRIAVFVVSPYITPKESDTINTDGNNHRNHLDETTLTVLKNRDEEIKETEEMLLKAGFFKLDGKGYCNGQLSSYYTDYGLLPEKARHVYIIVRTPSFKRRFGDWEKKIIKEAIESYPSMSIPMKYMAQTAKERKHIAKNLLGKNFFVEKQMGKIAVTKSSISESFAHSSYDAKLNVVPFLKELLETSVYAGTLPDFHGKDEQNYYFVSRIQQECKDKLVFFRIKEKSNRGKSFYVHDIYTEDQIKNQRSSNQVRSQEGMVEPESVGLAERLLREIYSVNSSVVVSENGAEDHVPRKRVFFHPEPAVCDMFLDRWFFSKRQRREELWRIPEHQEASLRQLRFPQRQGRQ